MGRVPVRDGRPCLFRVVRVSGTIIKVEEEAVRRAKLLVLAAKDEMAGNRGSSAADALGALLRSDSRAPSAAVPGGQVDSEAEAESGGLSSDDG